MTILRQAQLGHRLCQKDIGEKMSARRHAFSILEELMKRALEAQASSRASSLAQAKV